jgi:hypothetical protein
MRRSAEVLVFLVLLTGFARAATIPITTCGQTIPIGAKGVVQNDLTCTDVQVARLGTGSGLDLNGHTISATGLGTVISVSSAGRHTVRGPGRLVNVSISCGAGFDYARSVKVQNVDIVAEAQGGIHCLDQDGYRFNRLSARNVTIEGTSPFGITGNEVKLSGVSVAGTTLIAVVADRLRARELSIVGNDAIAITGDRGYADLVSLSNSDIRDNGYGIIAVRAKLRNTTATGNGVPDGWDLDTFEMPLLTGSSTCDRSLNPGASASWGVCADD